jgi:integrase/recombinase XerD
MPAIRLLKKVNLNGEWKMVPVPRNKTSWDTDKVVLNGNPVKAPDGMFYLQWRHRGKLVSKSVGPNARTAVNRWRTKQWDEDEGAVEIPTAHSAVTLQQAVDSYVADTKSTKSVSTARHYRQILEWFLTHTKKEMISEFTRQDILGVFSAGRQAGLNQKTINKRAIVTLAALRRAGAKIEMLKGDWPRTVEKTVGVYDPADLTKFLAACSPDEQDIFRTFLLTGFRHMEVATLEWADIDWKQKTVSVRSKADLGFYIKTYEERSVPMFPGLLECLQTRFKGHMKQRLIFPSPAHPKRPDYGGEAIDYHMLERCKEVALRAGVNCGRCADSKGRKCSEHPTCVQWNLHKFRHTYPTMLLRDGMDIRTVQKLLGHKSITTTEKYLTALKMSDIHLKVENTTLSEF